MFITFPFVVSYTAVFFFLRTTKPEQRWRRNRARVLCMSWLTPSPVQRWSIPSSIHPSLSMCAAPAAAAAAAAASRKIAYVIWSYEAQVQWPGSPKKRICVQKGQLYAPPGKPPAVVNERSRLRYTSKTPAQAVDVSLAHRSRSLSLPLSLSFSPVCCCCCCCCCCWLLLLEKLVVAGCGGEKVKKADPRARKEDASKVPAIFWFFSFCFIFFFWIFPIIITPPTWPIFFFFFSHGY